MIKITKSRLTALMTLLLSAFALFAALKGLLDQNVYKDAISTGAFLKELIIGTFSQDLISVPAAVILAILSIIYLIKKGEKIFIGILGLTGYFLSCHKAVFIYLEAEFLLILLDVIKILILVIVFLKQGYLAYTSHHNMIYKAEVFITNIYGHDINSSFV